MAKIKRYLIKTIMFVSSYFPLYLMLLVLQYEKYDTAQELKQIFCEFKSIKVFVYTTVMILGIVISLLSVFLLRIGEGNKPLTIEEIERPDDTIISYMMTYIIPILTTNFLENGEIIVNVILFLLIGYLYIRLNLLYLNPLWSMFGYLSYRVNSDVVIITNIEYSKLKQIKKSKSKLKGFNIANDIFVAQKKNNDY